MIRRLGYAAVVAWLVGVTTACSTTSPSPPALQDTAWVLAELPGQALLPDTAVTLRFEAAGVSGTDGCNRFLAPYQAAAGTLRVELTGPSTLMACEAGVEAQADRFRSALQEARRYVVEAGRLRLLGDDGGLLMVLEPQLVELPGTAWQVTGYANGRGGVVSVLQDSSLTLVFGQDDSVSGSAGCNRYRSGYSRTGDGLKFGAVATTRMVCQRPRGIMEQEQRFLAALTTVATVVRSGSGLELRAADGSLALKLVPDSPSL